MAIKNIVFDLGNVLNRCDLDYAVGKLAERSTWNRDEFMDWLTKSDVIDRFDGGKLSEVEFHNELAALSGWQGSPEETQIIWEEMLSSDEEMLRLMRFLKDRGYNIYILSNINPIHSGLIGGVLSFIAETHGYIFSCESGMIKPEPEIFHHLLSTFNLQPSETLFIDDKEANVLAAREIGITSIVHRSYAETCLELNRIGIATC